MCIQRNAIKLKYVYCFQLPINARTHWLISSFILINHFLFRNYFVCIQIILMYFCHKSLHKLSDRVQNTSRPKQRRIQTLQLAREFQGRASVATSRHIGKYRVDQTTPLSIQSLVDWARSRDAEIDTVDIGVQNTSRMRPCDDVVPANVCAKPAGGWRPTA